MSSRVSPPLRREQQEATRQRLMTAAREIFVTQGFIESTVGQIAQSAGTSRATFYLHFRSKSDVMVATWSERELPEMDTRLAAFDRVSDFSVAATRRWMDDFIAYLESNAGIMHSAAQAMAIEPELSGRWVSGMMAAAADMPNLVHALGGGEAGRDALLLRVVQVERTFHLWSEHMLPLSRERLIDGLARAWSVSS